MKEDASNGGLQRWLGIALLLMTFAVSTAAAIWNSLSIEEPGRTTLRIAHWQLEHGYREAMQAIIEDYERLHPDLHIEQVPLPVGVYAQSINTQLISNTAPDLCEMGNSDLTTKDDNTVRYFLPLGDAVGQPNAYNRGTDLAAVAWKDTLLDGMRGGYRDGLSDYYAVPTTTTSMRLYYNRQLLKAATGTDAPTRSFGQWMKVCQQIRDYADRHDGRILPIVSCYDLATMQLKYEVPFTAAFEDRLDADRNGDVSALEAYVGYCQGVIGPRSPEIQAVFETLRAVGDQMQQGFSAMDRQQAQFRFVNGLAAFMWSGSWDAGGTQALARRAGYDIGIMRLPLPADGEANAELVTRNVAEPADGGGMFGVTRQSPHAAEAVNFLRYLTSRAVNEKFNRLAEWPPIAIGAKASDLMAPFATDLNGSSTRVALTYGTRAARDVANEATNYFQGDITLDAFQSFFDRALQDPLRGGDWAWWREFDERRSDVRNKERIIARQQALDLLSDEPTKTNETRRAILQQVIRNDALDYPHLFQQTRGKAMPQF